MKYTKLKLPSTLVRNDFLLSNSPSDDVFSTALEKLLPRGIGILLIAREEIRQILSPNRTT